LGHGEKGKAIFQKESKKQVKNQTILSKSKIKPF